MLEAILVGIIDAFLLRKTMQFCSGVDILCDLLERLRLYLVDGLSSADRLPHREGLLSSFGERHKFARPQRALSYTAFRREPEDPGLTTCRRHIEIQTVRVEVASGFGGCDKFGCKCHSRLLLQGRCELDAISGGV